MNSFIFIGSLKFTFFPSLENKKEEREKEKENESSKFYRHGISFVLAKRADNNHPTTRAHPCSDVTVDTNSHVSVSKSYNKLHKITFR